MSKLNFLILAIVLISMTLFVFYMCSKKTPEELKVVAEVIDSPKERKVLEKPEGKGVRYGKASYYGGEFNGRLTANSEIFDSDKFTCASPTLPFNTLVKVTNLENNKQVVVRVNDRGPFKMNSKGIPIRPLKPHPSRILDLSKRSFQEIGKTKVGLLRIKYEVVG